MLLCKDDSFAKEHNNPFATVLHLLCDSCHMRRTVWHSSMLHKTWLQQMCKRSVPGLQMQAQEAEQRADAVEVAAQQQQPSQNPFKLYVTSAITAILSFAVVSGVYNQLMSICMPSHT